MITVHFDNTSPIRIFQEASRSLFRACLWLSPGVLKRMEAGGKELKQVMAAQRNRKNQPVALLGYCKFICCLHYFLYRDTLVDKIHHMFHIGIDVVVEVFESCAEVV